MTAGKKRGKTRSIKITPIKKKRKPRKFITWMNEHWNEFDSWQELKTAYLKYRDKEDKE